MPIEFRCPQCRRLLRVGEDTAGKQAQCPECGAISTVPAGSGPVVGGFVPPPPPSPPGGASPFARGGPEPARPAPPEYSYTAPAQFGGAQACGPALLAANRVAGPAVGLIVTCAIGLPFQLIAILFNLAGAGMGVFGPPRHMMPVMFSSGVNVALNVVSMVIGIVVIFGAIKMKNLENYGLAMTSAIVALIPCISPCCLLGLPFGIWALVVLADPQVKAAFRN